MPLRRRATALVFASTFVLIGDAAVGRAQTTTLDAGTFQIMVDGRQVGTETFSIRRNGNGVNSVTIAQGRVVLDTSDASEEISASLELNGEAFRPSAYEVVVRGAESQRIAGRLIGRRFSANIVSPAGERMREYPAGDGAVLVDEGIIHHHHFLARLAEAGERRVPAIVPRQSRQAMATVRTRGSDAVRVGGRSVDARRIVVEIDGEPARHLWVDDSSRLLRFEVPDRRLVAERTERP